MVDTLRIAARIAARRTYEGACPGCGTSVLAMTDKNMTTMTCPFCRKKIDSHNTDKVTGVNDAVKDVKDNVKKTNKDTRETAERKKDAET